MTMTSTSNGSGTAGIASRAAETAHGIVDRFAGAAVPVVDHLAGSAHATVDKAASAVDTLEKTGGELARASGKLVSSARNFVGGKPLAVLGFGLLAGLLISRLIR